MKVERKISTNAKSPPSPLRFLQLSTVKYFSLGKRKADLYNKNNALVLFRYGTISQGQLYFVWIFLSSTPLKGVSCWLANFVKFVKLYL